MLRSNWSIMVDNKRLIATLFPWSLPASYWKASSFWVVTRASALGPSTPSASAPQHGLVKKTRDYHVTAIVGIHRCKCMYTNVCTDLSEYEKKDLRWKRGLNKATNHQWCFGFPKRVSLPYLKKRETCAEMFRLALLTSCDMILTISTDWCLNITWMIIPLSISG